MDPLQSFENFRTPFRETQFAVLALSAYYPQSGRPGGWDSREEKTLSHNPVKLLQQLDQVWDRPSPALLTQIESALSSNSVMVRRAAAEALGWVAIHAAAPRLTLFCLAIRASLCNAPRHGPYGRLPAATPILQTYLTSKPVVERRTRPLGGGPGFAHRFRSCTKG